MTAHNFAIEFYNEVQQVGHAVEQQLQAEAEARLQRVAASCRSLRAATVAIEQPLQHDFSHLYMVLIVVVDTRQKKSAIAARATSAEAALQQALTLLERQLALRYPPPKPFLLRAWAALWQGPLWQLWENLTNRWHNAAFAQAATRRRTGTQLLCPGVFKKYRTCARRESGHPESGHPMGSRAIPGGLPAGCRRSRRLA